jgi:PAS domain S-box-containing protein
MPQGSNVDIPQPDLRQQAEAVLRHRPEAPPQPEEALQRLVLELQVHQVELQLQNEALRRSQEALQRARDQYAMLYDFAPVGYLTLDARGIILAANLTAAEQLGVDRSALQQTPLARFLVRDDQDIFYLHRCQVLEGDALQSCDLRLQRPDGTVLLVSLESRRVQDVSGQGYQCFTTLSDMTARKQAAEELQRADRLALVGQLASGLAHEIGTPLNVIAGNSELLRMDLQAQHLPTETVEVIIRQTDRITGLVQQLLNFARSEQRVMQSFPLCAPLEEALCLLKTHFRRDIITVTCDIPDDLPPLWGIADQIEQVFLNVLVNAWHAMPTGGTLTITARETAEQMIHVTFRDTGTGMETAALERAFEPFYTTKGHSGTGLGLAICKQIIETHRGNMVLESTPGDGTTVHLDLVCAPRAD